MLRRGERDGRGRGGGTATAIVREASEWGIQRSEGEGLLEREEGSEGEGKGEGNGEEESKRQIEAAVEESIESSDVSDAVNCTSRCHLGDASADAVADARHSNTREGDSSLASAAAVAAVAASAGDSEGARGKLSVPARWLQGAAGKGSGKGGGGGQQCGRAEEVRANDFGSFQSQVVSWCVDHGFEFVECCAADGEFDKGKC